MSVDAREKRRTSAAPEGWKELELSVRRLLASHEDWRRRAREAEGRVAELEESLQAVSAGLDPAALQRELERERARASDLERRLTAGRERVEALLLRLRFVQDDRV